MGTPRLRAMATPDFLLDKRVVYRNIAKGLVQKKELDRYISSLPDVEELSEPCIPDPPEEEEEATEEGAEAETGEEG